MRLAARIIGSIALWLGANYLMVLTPGSWGRWMAVGWWLGVPVVTAFVSARVLDAHVVPRPILLSAMTCWLAGVLFRASWASLVPAGGTSLLGFVTLGVMPDLGAKVSAITLANTLVPVLIAVVVSWAVARRGQESAAQPEG